MILMKKRYKTLIIIEIVILFFILSIYIICHTKLVQYIPKCIFIKKLHFICPSCGGTRFMISLLNFNIIQAFCIHPVFFILICYLLLINIVYIINVICNKKIEIFRWWHIVFWAILMVIFTIFRNIIV